MRFGVLGPLTVWDDEGEPVRVPEAKVRALLADLLVHEGRPVSADRLIDDLWGEQPPGHPANALQSKVSQLRRALGGDRVVRQTPGYRLRVDAAGDEVDAHRFRDLVAEARTTDDPRLRSGLLSQALELWRGPAYADFADEEFVRAAAHRLAEQRLGVIEEQAEARLASGDHTLLVGELTDQVARHPLRERLRAVQMRALYLTGRQSEALASYAELREHLADELGLDPGPEVTALHEAILRQDPGLLRHTDNSGGAYDGGAADGAGGALGLVGVSSVDRASEGVSARSSLPSPLTELVGRAPALDEIRQLLGSARLVTLTGPGGVGKTRLAVEAAARCGRDAGEVWFVELAGRRGGGVDDLVSVISAALGIREDTPAGLPGRAPAERLAAALRDRRLLLVLDNCEHLVEPVAELTGLLLGAAPGLRVLATSQEPLGLTGESVYAVEPLQLPESIRLFVARATASAPGFTLDDADPATRDAVAEICHRLDGIPLALELAATRVRALGVRELAARLGDRFRVLTAGQRGAPARQQTLRAVIDWSWELLSPPERTVLCRLAVHRDGCTLDAAETVCAGGDVAHVEVLDLLARLVDRSLVFLVSPVEGTADTGPRYRLLESVAAYATERLHETVDVSGVRDRHASHYLELAERADPHLRGAAQREWLARLDAEAANLREALDHAVRRAAADGTTDTAVRLVTALSWWWLLRGRLNEAGTALAAVCAVDATAAEPRLLHAAFGLLTGESRERPAPPTPPVEASIQHDGGRPQWLYAYALFSSGDTLAGEKANRQVLDHFTATGDRWGTAAALALAAMHALARGDLAVIERDGAGGAELFRELGDRWGELQTVTPLAALAEIRGDYADAERRQREGLDIAEELGLATEISARLSGLGRLALPSRDWERARELHEQARRLAVEQGYLYGEVHALMGLALGARRSGDLDGAQEYLVRLRDGYPSSEAGAHLLCTELGLVAELRGDGPGATAHQLRGLRLALSLGEPRALALSLEGLAGAAALSGEAGGARHAALLLGAATAARRSVDAPLPESERADVDRVTEAALAALGRAAFTEAYERGIATDPAEVARSAAAGLSPQA
ncbi:winged helix-turn-helix domain-containing protein [Streptomyces sp. NBC_01381]|uniref:AfsR/SARP family transcriptional regulator n=1 Tax=Streptomyces sp. NBC_01381 TaxID=2903845 RepID=UPI002252A28C|nr:BTAD domain-containing putative transcriptional regulator [Streptomyces sp. NBC_01381]MCX4669227.1 winged helix-turn-helix domain-containing protein [Streptomyces sp. NBC_01381]